MEADLVADILNGLAPALVGGIVGWVAAVRARSTPRAFLLYVPAGMGGALLGAWLLGIAGLATTGPGGLLLRSVVGAIPPILLLRWIEKRRG